MAIRNDTASPWKRLGNSRLPVSTSSRPRQAKEDTAGEAQLTYSCQRARLHAIPARCSTFAVSKRIFVARLFRGCFVLSTLTPAAGFLSAWCVRFRSRHFDSRNSAHARAENALVSGVTNAANAYSCRAETDFSAPSRADHLSASGSLR